MWPFSKIKKLSQPKVFQWEAPEPCNTSCGAECACDFTDRFRYERLPQLIGRNVDVASILSVPEDTRVALQTPYVGKVLEWPDEESLPRYAGVMWKHRRVYLTFETDNSVSCKAPGRAADIELGLYLEPHQYLLEEIEKYGDRIFCQVLLMDPSGGDLLGPEKNMGLIRGEAYIRIKKSEEPIYSAALDAYCARSGKTTENLTFDDGVNCFLATYLPREFVVADACLTNLPLFMQLYNFVM